MDFVKTVCRSSEGDGYRVFQSEGDANTGIVSETTKLATEGYLVTVIAHDTDILFLFHSPPPYMVDNYMHSQGQNSWGKMKKLFSILQNPHGMNVTQHHLCLGVGNVR